MASAKGAETAEDSKDNKDASEHINLKVVNQDGAVVQFKIKKHSTMKKLMATYCERMNLSHTIVRFRFDGDPISASNTPKELGLQDGDSIDIFQEQTGGGTVRPIAIHHHYHRRRHQHFRSD